MDDALVELAARYQRYIRWLERIPTWLPWSGQAWLAAEVGRRCSPHLARRTDLQAALESALGLSPENADRVLERWFANQGQLGRTMGQYGHLDAAWLQREVEVDAPDLLQSLWSEGGLAMFYHCHHQNTLACIMGLGGRRVTALASAPTASPLYPLLGEFIDRINDRSARQFNGGGYLYTERLRETVRETRSALARRDVVVALCDVHQPGPGGQGDSYACLGRRVKPPTGAVELALRAHVPCYALILYFTDGRYRLRLRRLDSSGLGLAEVMEQYFSNLESFCRQEPACWQGWEWYNSLPLLN